MSRSTQEASVERSHSDPQHEDLGCQIVDLYTRLVAVTREEAGLRISLKTLLDREEEKYMEACRKAEQNITAFRAKREKITREINWSRTSSLVSH
jgi:hypothetical protein